MRSGGGDDDVAIGTNQFDLGAATVGGSFAPVAGDFDGNGADDVFWYAPTAQDYLWTFNATGGGYTSTPYSVNTSGYDLATGDVDGNGRDDLLFSNPAGTDNLWWGQASIAGFGSSNQKPLTISSGVTPVMGDFDGDGKTDLFLYKGAVTGDDMWWGAAPADFSTAAGGTGLQHLTPTHQTTYTYDADGIRASKKTDAGPTQKFTYTAGTGLPVLLTQQAGTDTTYLVYGPGNQPVEQINPDGTAQWLHHDQLGSVRLATRAADGTESSRRTFDAYGTVADQAITSGSKQPLLGYAGQYTDPETGSSRKCVRSRDLRSWLCSPASLLGAASSCCRRSIRESSILPTTMANEVTPEPPQTEPHAPARCSPQAWDMNVGTVADQAITSGSKQPLLGYAGQYTDSETGYQYLRARYHDPTTGQFLTKDPLVAQTRESYGYASSNPTRLTDPSGMRAHDYDDNHWDFLEGHETSGADQCTGDASCQGMTATGPTGQANTPNCDDPPSANSEKGFAPRQQQQPQAVV